MPRAGATMLDAAFYIWSAFWLGALHAATPGHGKTVAAAYLVGNRGRAIDAVTLGIIVTLSHTGGIVLFGVLASMGSSALLPRQAEGWLALATGVLIVGLGLWMLWSQRGAFPWTDGPAPERSVQDHDHSHGHESSPGHSRGDDHAHRQEHGHDDLARHSHNHGHEHGEPVHAHRHVHGREHSHGHEHGHAHEHDSGGAAVAYAAEATLHRHGWGRAHSHTIALNGANRPSFGLLLGLGIAGGIMPDPAALAVLLSALASGKLVLGLLTVLVFSLGFASVLVAVGIVAARLGTIVLDRLGSGAWTRWVQLATSVVVVGVGVVMTASAWYSLAWLT